MTGTRREARRCVRVPLHQYHPVGTSYIHLWRLLRSVMSCPLRIRLRASQENIMYFTKNRPRRGE